MRPCVSCIYKPVCGNTGRTVPCDGKVTKRDRIHKYAGDIIRKDNNGRANKVNSYKRYKEADALDTKERNALYNEVEATIVGSIMEAMDL